MSATSESTRILMIEDDANLVRLVDVLLSKGGYRNYELVSEGYACTGLERITSERFDVVILDLGLPDSQGLDTFHKLQAQAPNVPVVIFSGLSDDAIAIEAVKSGAQDYLVKGDVSGQLITRSIKYAIERKRGELAIRENEEKYRRLIETMSGTFYQMSVPDGTYDFISPACLQVFGYSAQDFLNKPIHLKEIIHPDSHSYFWEKWSNLIEGNIAATWEYKTTDSQGNARWITQSNSGIFDGEGTLIAIEGICINVTRTKRREEEIRHLSSVMEQSTEGMAFCDLEGNLISVNSTFATMHGYTRRELIGRHVSLFFPIDQIASLDRIRRVTMEEGSYTGEMWHIKTDGSTFLCQVNMSVILDNEGKSVGTVETIRDITEIRKAEQALRESEERWRSLVDNTKDIVQILDNKGNILAMNKVYPPHRLRDVIGRPVYEFMEDESRKHTRTAIEKLLLEKEPQELEIIIPLEGYEDAWFEVKFVPMLVDGEVDKVISLVSDIRERKVAELALRESEEKMSAVVNTVIDGLYISSPEGRIVLANDSAARMIGYQSKDEITGLDATVFLAPSDREMVIHHMLQAWMEGKSIERMECRYLRADGNEIDGEFSSALMYDASGKPAGWVIASRDITQRKRAEAELRQAHIKLQEAHDKLKTSQEQLIQAEKMSAVGTMVAGVAHELNNPLTSILNFTRYCIKYTDEESKLHGVLEDVVNETMRCADIVDNLLTFSTMGDREDREYIHCDIIIDRVIRLIKYRLEKGNVKLIRNSQDVPMIYVHANSIQQVLLNLITNALDAMETSPEKTISIDIQNAGDFVWVAIADTGPGISQESINRIFDPFFTTKAPGKGTGLGLTVTRNLIAMHGGTISCETELGKGTRFVVQLPIEQQS